MYRKIMVPVDLAHIERLDKGITTATDLVGHYGIPICFVGVTAEHSTEVAHTPQEFAAKLERFGAAQSQDTVATDAYPSHDPAVDLDDVLIAAAKENRAGLIVMASARAGRPGAHLRLECRSRGCARPGFRYSSSGSRRLPHPASAHRADEANHRVQTQPPRLGPGKANVRRIMSAQMKLIPEGPANIIATGYTVGQDDVQPDWGASASTFTIRCSSFPA